MNTNLFLIIISCSIIGVIYSIILIKQILAKSPGNKRMADISKMIQKGSKTFLNKQYSTISSVASLIFVILLYLLGWKVALGFLLGACFSAIAGYVGMFIATRANSRTTEEARKKQNGALNIAFKSGSVMGLMVASLGLLATTLFYFIFKDTEALISLGFGGSFVALFARVGGGIFTKAADVGADIVGKIEKNIPEDDPRNPAVIADNVGDNVGDVAGMGADLYESYVDSILIAMILGITVSSAEKGLIAPLLLAGAGIVASIIASWFVKIGKGGAAWAINKAVLISAFLVLISGYLLAKFFANDLNIFYVISIGLVSGVVIGFITEYFTSHKFKPTIELAKSSETGSATNVISGLSLGMLTTIFPALIIGIAIISSYHFLGLYGVALAAVGMLSTLGTTLAADTYGPVVDNAAGISEMSNLDHEVRKNTEELDAVGNTTAAIGKGFAIGSAALTSLALFAGYAESVNLSEINLISPWVISGLLLGAALPYLFSSLTIKAVGRASSIIIIEVRRQFTEIKGLISGKQDPDYDSCIKISTKAAINQMIFPSLIAIVIPIIIGLVLGVEALGGLLAGTIISGFLLAVMMANSGGSFDNAKKYIENGSLGGADSEAHKASVVGDTVGDPLKDTAGPSINILIKLISIVSLLISPLLMKISLSFEWRVILVGAFVILLSAYVIFFEQLQKKQSIQKINLKKENVKI